jgi:hypothetical protein
MRCLFTILLISIILPICTTLNAQPSEAEIKLSGNFHWGEGIALEKSAAEELARQNLINRIVVMVTSEMSSVEQEIGTEYSSDFRSRTRATSRLQLRGLQYRSEQRRDRSWQIVAYIHKDTFNESLKIDEGVILSKLSEADALHESRQSQRAMPLYKEVYLSTFYHPVPLYTDEKNSGSRVLVRNYAQSQLLDWMRQLDIRVAEVRSRSTDQNTELYVDLEVKDGQMSVDQLVIRVNRTGYGSHRVTSGAVSVYLDQAPDNRMQQLEIELRINPSVISDEGLQELAVDVGPSFTRMVNVDYTPVIRLDMRASALRGNQVNITPIISNLSVFSLEWQLPDGTTSRDPILSYYRNTALPNHVVTLVVNNSKELTTQREVTEDGQLRNVLTETSQTAIAGRTPTRTESTSRPEVLTTPGSRTNDRPGDRNSGLTTTPSRATDTTPSGTRSASNGPGAAPISSADVVASHTQFIQHIIRIRNAEQLAAHLTQLQSRDVVMFGQRSNVTNPDLSYIAIIDQRSREVLTIVTPVNAGKRRNLYTNESFDAGDVAAQFRGHGAIWFQFK